MKKVILITCLAATSIPVSVQAQQINQQLACQAHLTHLEGKLSDVKAVYGAGSTMKIKNGIKAYQAFLAKEHIEPGMQQFPEMKAQVEQMQLIMSTNYDKQFPEARYFTNNAMIISNCYKQFPPSSSSDDAMVRGMIDKIIEVAQP